MPVVEVKLWDLERLTGASLDESTVRDLLPRLKCEVEEVSGEDVVYEATHDRPDLYSAELLSVYLKGLLGVEDGLPRPRVGSAEGVAEVEGPAYRPYAFFAVVRGVSLDDEAIRQLMQLQEKVHLTYGRNRRKVSIGLYDLDGIKLPVRYVAASPETRMKPLGFAIEMTLREVLEKHPKGVEYGHLVKGHGEYPLIVDAEGKVVSFPPITNSEDFRVTESTRDVLIDVTSTDPEAGRRIISLFAHAVAVRGGEVRPLRLKGALDEESPRMEPEEVVYDVSMNRDLLGLDLGVEETVRLLRAMRMDAEPAGNGKVAVRYPYFRVDILHPVDIAEEVAMGYGYERIEPAVIPPLHPGREDPIEVFTRALREGMVGLGFVEVNNYMMTSASLMFDAMLLPRQPIVEVENPRHEAYHALRTWIVPQLLRLMSSSKHAGYPQRVFEAGDVAIPDESRDNRVREERRLAFAVAGKGVTLTDGLAALKGLFRQLGVSFKLEKAEHPSFIAGRVARVVTEAGDAGIVGEVHPQVLVNFGLEVPVVAGELNVEVVMKCYLARLGGA
ncbi:phenylalanine--tRNA ligase subunit beta [Thermofilum pendens]|uniref:Phenylalanine--tRNA ligase beta subunit n=1 Tax=Thermofilum pendens (strain DSM 2475 / Hrk 5) TaxID=368408 RepID=SYFB_THEPD|nr:phenylalanine--tRNA ligase subunit beta [Thermofilum pendens]A1RYS1.1 RecName: Full=Phenylalanine--tRNA ligase beta subunit; AltName: Full=Phenylalanyl-tRNA synthetase beta subunit; Short=PheRS [Thermofilum pendens Hrk 5]ABL78351.1 phenylalanyl-tRNA synthetase beta subunit [Thermofilum pendens Hrk 5]